MKPLEDFDETARLILMENEKIGLVLFAKKMTEVHPGLPLVGTTVRDLWTKYKGFDGRILPTHDIETGERIFRRL